MSVWMRDSNSCSSSIKKKKCDDSSSGNNNNSRRYCVWFKRIFFLPYNEAGIHLVRWAYVCMRECWFEFNSSVCFACAHIHTHGAYSESVQREILQPQPVVIVFSSMRACVVRCVYWCLCVFSTYNSWYYWQLAGWRLLLLLLLLLHATDWECVCVSAIHLYAWYFLSNDKLCVR